MEALRTPDERFVGLPDYPFEPSYATVAAAGSTPLRMHYVDAGPHDGPVALLLHGQPTWSFLYRKTIPVLTDGGMRVIAPDMIGYGRSDKLTEATDYTFERQIEWMAGLVSGLDLREVTLVVQDWGGPVGLGVLAAMPERFARAVATNTILHTSDPSLAGRLTWANHGDGEGRVVLEEALVDYVMLFQRLADIVPSAFVNAVAGPLAPDVLAAYDAPFPDRRYKAGLRQMTGLIPLTRNDPGAAIDRATMAVLERWDKPFLTAYSDADPATRGWDSVFQERVPGARGREHPVIAGAGHFVQEHHGAQLGAIALEFARST